MEQPTLVEMEFTGRPFDEVRPLALSEDAALILTERGTDRKLMLRVGRAELGAIHQARGVEGPFLPLPPPPLTASLPLRLLTSLGARVERVVVQKLVENTFYATVTVAYGEEHAEVDVRPSEALALAASSSAPIYAVRSVLDATGFDAAEWEGKPEAKQQFKQRLAARVEQAEPLTGPALRLSPEIQRQVDDCLARLLTDVRARVVVLMHHSGTLVAWQGSGDEAALAHYTKALAAQDNNPRDLGDLVRYEQILTDEIFPPETNLLFFHVRTGWRLQFGDAPGNPTFDDTHTLPRAMMAVHELNCILPPDVAIA